ncbi:autophagy-related protein ATG17 [Acrasis kona]|uniref:Autophagy-related protein ATG17 n=1 Tax=Acrasis kona TaxID=1008807 RepID=A0AAW2Z876_9EUKA
MSNRGDSNINDSITSSLIFSHFDTYTNPDDETEVQTLLSKLSNRSKQRLDQAEQKLMQAKKRDQEYIEYCKKYTVTQTKLSVIFSEIQRQMGVLKRLVISIGGKSKAMLGEIEKFRMYQETCIYELTIVLERLQKKPLHSQLVNSQTTASSSLDKKTLFDFVNIESVTDLKLRAEEELNETKGIEQLANTILVEVDDQFREISQSSRKLFESNPEIMSAYQEGFNLSTSSSHRRTPSQDLALHDASTQQNISTEVDLNKNEIKAMSNIVLEVAGHHDRLKHVLSNPVFSSTIDVEEMEEKTNQLSNKIHELEQLSTRIDVNCSQVQSRYTRFSDFYRSAMGCHQDLLKISPGIPPKVVQIDEVKTIFHQRRMNCDVIFEEIRDLTLWYGLFMTSYDKLLTEIERRRKEQDKSQKMVEQFKKQLNQEYETEELARQQFFEDYGKYLPVSLCPSIMEKATKYQIVSENFTSSLPDVRDNETSESL